MEHVSVPVTVSTIVAGKFRRYAHLSVWQHLTSWHVVKGNVSDVAKIIIGFFQSLGLIIRFWPDVVFAKGGYVCLPLGLAAWILRRPLVIHDSDTRPGLTNRVLARFATKIATGSPLENYPYDPAKSTYVGVPIDDTFRPVSTKQQREYKQELGVDPDKKLVVAMGGGLGAVSINDAMAIVATELRDDDVVVYNITGKKNIDRATEKAVGIDNYIATPFVYEGMHKVLGAADIVVSRASATFLQELAGLKKVVIAVPARQLGDQLKNAHAFAAAGAVVSLSDTDIETPDILKEVIQDLLSNAQKRETLAEALHEFARPDAAASTAKLILSAPKAK
ncbi:MAG: UDP-N-acetylglucosamine--N-acetylmuramyl-(pentapeptide) pyrophosphoryl-undecaprenol [Candidatus Saccharibacteria bacterium]|nr:UDP-N-acetylglucosamine--N-acetylmuramyl-(pentapeptide) pyrophosphoryl-undecaprenol [Candidatus Saccharibacteria bacterium]